MKKIIIIFILLILCIIVCKKTNYSDPTSTKIESITASSTLESKDDHYSVNNLIGGTLKSWSEGVKGDGIGETITMTFASPVEIKSVFMYNGIPRDFALNNRVKDFEVNGITKTAQDIDALQEFDLVKPIKSNKLIFTIKSVYKGSKWDDTCITEIQFTRNELIDPNKEKASEKSVKEYTEGFTKLIALKGSYSGEKTAKDFEGGREVIVYSMTISEEQGKIEFGLGAEPGIGALVMGEVKDCVFSNGELSFKVIDNYSTNQSEIILTSIKDKTMIVKLNNSVLDTFHKYEPK